MKHVVLFLVLFGICGSGCLLKAAAGEKNQSISSGPPASPAEDGVIGATCSAEPQCPDCDEKGNVCQGVKDKFYPGVLMSVAKKAVIKECQDLNALDYCGASGCKDGNAHRKKYGGGCYPQCEKVANCIYFDNR